MSLVCLVLTGLLAAAFVAAQEPAPTPGQPATPAPQPAFRPTVIVIDPAHGGADAGARGASGVQEKDVVLNYAVLLRDLLQRRGLRVVLTRQAGDNPSADDRAAAANAYRDSIFISLHAASTGRVGTARCYFDAPTPRGPLPVTAPLAWDRAQEPFSAASQRLANLIQAQLHQAFPGSPAEPQAAPVRPLRNVAAPAIAVEVSSVSVRNREPLDAMALPLAEAVARAVSAFRGGA